MLWEGWRDEGAEDEDGNLEATRKQEGRKEMEQAVRRKEGRPDFQML